LVPKSEAKLKSIIARRTIPRIPKSSGVRCVVNIGSNENPIIMGIKTASEYKENFFKR